MWTDTDEVRLAKMQRIVVSPTWMLVSIRPESRPGRAPQRYLRVRFGVISSVTIIVGLLFSLLVQISHLVLVRHTTCHHGKLIHEESAHARPALPSDAKEQHFEKAPRRAQGEHEHCHANALPHRMAELRLPIANATLLFVFASPALTAQFE